MRDHHLRERRLRLGLAQWAIAQTAWPRADARSRATYVSNAETGRRTPPHVVRDIRRALVWLELAKRYGVRGVPLAPLDDPPPPTRSYHDPLWADKMRALIIPHPKMTVEYNGMTSSITLDPDTPLDVIRKVFQMNLDVVLGEPDGD